MSSPLSLVRPPRRPHAQYECTACGGKWAQAQSRTSCPKCSCDYVRWTNYAAWRAAATFPGREGKKD